MFDVENHGQILVTAAMNSHPLSFECFQEKNQRLSFNSSLCPGQHAGHLIKLLDLMFKKAFQKLFPSTGPQGFIPHDFAFATAAIVNLRLKV